MFVFQISAGVDSAKKQAPPLPTQEQMEKCAQYLKYIHYGFEFLSSKGHTSDENMQAAFDLYYNIGYLRDAVKDSNINSNAKEKLFTQLDNLKYNLFGSDPFPSLIPPLTAIATHSRLEEHLNEDKNAIPYTEDNLAAIDRLIKSSGLSADGVSGFMEQKTEQKVPEVKPKNRLSEIAWEMYSNIIGERGDNALSEAQELQKKLEEAYPKKKRPKEITGVLNDLNRIMADLGQGNVAVTKAPAKVRVFDVLDRLKGVPAEPAAAEQVEKRVPSAPVAQEKKTKEATTPVQKDESKAQTQAAPTTGKKEEFKPAKLEGKSGLKVTVKLIPLDMVPGNDKYLGTLSRLFEGAKEMTRAQKNQITVMALEYMRERGWLEGVDTKKESDLANLSKDRLMTLQLVEFNLIRWKAYDGKKNEKTAVAELDKALGVAVKDGKPTTNLKVEEIPVHFWFEGSSDMVKSLSGLSKANKEFLTGSFKDIVQGKYLAKGAGPKRETEVGRVEPRGLFVPPLVVPESLTPISVEQQGEGDYYGWAGLRKLFKDTNEIYQNVIGGDRRPLEKQELTSALNSYFEKRSFTRQDVVSFIAAFDEYFKSRKYSEEATAKFVDDYGKASVKEETQVKKEKPVEKKEEEKAVKEEEKQPVVKGKTKEKEMPADITPGDAEVYAYRGELASIKWMHNFLSDEKNMQVLVGACTKKGIDIPVEEVYAAIADYVAALASGELTPPREPSALTPGEALAIAIKARYNSKHNQ